VKRVLVTGNAGAGKTTFAQQLAAQSGLPYFGLDTVVWRPGWQKASPGERLEAELSIAGKEGWIVDGVSDVLLEIADTIVFLDLPRPQCMLRVAWRSLPYLFRSRPGLPDRCPEIMILPKVSKIIWRYPGTQKPKVLAEAAKRSVRLVHICDKASYLVASRDLALAVS
jgi:adenylate kinase family enzyme